MTSGSRCPVQVTQVLPGSGSREWGEGPVSGAVDPAPALNGKPLLLFYHTLRTYVIVSFKGFMCLKKKILKTTVTYICCFQAHKKN